MKKVFHIFITHDVLINGSTGTKVLFQRGFGEIGKQQGVHHESIRSKNEVGDTAQWSWKKYRFKTLKKDKFLKELDRINKAFQKIAISL